MYGTCTYPSHVDNLFSQLDTLFEGTNLELLLISVPCHFLFSLGTLSCLGIIMEQLFDFLSVCITLADIQFPLAIFWLLKMMKSGLLVLGG